MIDNDICAFLFYVFAIWYKCIKQLHRAYYVWIYLSVCAGPRPEKWLKIFLVRFALSQSTAVNGTDYVSRYTFDDTSLSRYYVCTLGITIIILGYYLNGYRHTTNKNILAIPRPEASLRKFYSPQTSTYQCPQHSFIFWFFALLFYFYT